MHKIVHFEMQVKNPQKTMEFYQKAFGWTFEKFEMEGFDEYWGVIAGKEDDRGINGGLMKTPDGTAKTVNVIQVESVDKSLEKVIALGATVAMPKVPLVGFGYIAYFVDPEGFVVGLFQDDTNAK